MTLNSSDKRFLKFWAEQRQGGRKSFTGIYTFGLSILVFLCFAALGLFLNLPFIEKKWLITIGIGALVCGFLLSLLIWARQEKRYQKLLDVEKSEGA